MVACGGRSETRTLVPGAGVGKVQLCSASCGNGKGRTILAGRSFMGKWRSIMIKDAFQQHLVVADGFV